MQSVKRHYFLSFAVMGSIMPFLAVFFVREQQLTQAQIGYAFSTAGLAILLSPVLVTFLADTGVASRRLLAGVFGFSGLALLGLSQVHGFWPTMLLFGAYNLTFKPVQSLQDGLYFSTQERDDLPRVAFHRVRVWGTVGFILPSAILFVLLDQGLSTQAILHVGLVFCALGVLNSLTLPDTRPAGVVRRAGGPLRALARRARRADRPVATFAAAHTMLRPPVLAFCLGMFLLHMASATYYDFYPLYVSDTVGIDDKWLGVIANVGVVLEIGYMLALGWALHRLGMRAFLTLGALAVAARLGILAAFPSVEAAVGTQAFHGIAVVATLVLPAMYLNGQADEANRNSIQGLYAMAVIGLGRMIGSLVGGQVAQVSLTVLFGYGAVLCLIAAALLGLAFRDGGGQAEQGRADAPERVGA